MTNHIAALIFVCMLLLWGVYEFGWGGGDPHDPHHNRPPWSMW